MNELSLKRLIIFSMHANLSLESNNVYSMVIPNTAEKSLRVSGQIIVDDYNDL
jgi:hypothetical protein